MKQGRGILLYLIVLLYCPLVFAITAELNPVPVFLFPVLWTAGMVLLWPAYRCETFITEASVLFIPWLIVRGDPGGDLVMVISLSYVLMVLAGHSVRSRAVTFLDLVVPSSQAASAIASGLVTPVGWNLFILMMTLAGMIIHVIQRSMERSAPVSSADCILSSYTGNTASMAGLFIEGACEGGLDIRIHRFHYYDGFSASLPGEMLVIAFPVFGWKTPWPLARYIMRDLPAGKGKPAVILYSSYGGPENAGVVAWLLLVLRGYRVLGRTWAMYPMNVATFRPGTWRFWNRTDKKSPSWRTVRDIRSAGRDLATGRTWGLPVILWPFFLSVPGFMLDNRLVNIFLYRNHAWRRRCTKCNLCVSACPSGRLSAGDDGYPTASGTCALCFQCVNICPANAMQLIGWSEYGRPYAPRWPKGVVIGRGRTKPVLARKGLGFRPYSGGRSCAKGDGKPD